MAELRTIVLKWDVHTGKLKCNTSYLKREERVDVDLYVANNGTAYALPTGWAINLTVKGDDATDGDALVAITSWSAAATTGLYQATAKAISSTELDTYLAINGSTTDDIASKYVDVDVYYTESAAMRAKSDTIRLTMKPDVGRTDDGTPTGTAVSITASGYTMSTNRLLGRTTASSGAVEEITVGSGLSLSGGSLTATATGITTIAALRAAVAASSTGDIIDVGNATFSITGTSISEGATGKGKLNLSPGTVFNYATATLAGQDRDLFIGNTRNIHNFGGVADTTGTDQTGASANVTAYTMARATGKNASWQYADGSTASAVDIVFPGPGTYWFDDTLHAGANSGIIVEKPGVTVLKWANNFAPTAGTTVATITSIDATQNTFTTSSAHKLAYAQRVQLVSTGTYPTGVSASTDYYVFPGDNAASNGPASADDATKFRLGTTPNLSVGSVVDISGSWTGTLTIKAMERFGIVVHRAVDNGSSNTVHHVQMRGLNLLASDTGNECFSGINWRGAQNNSLKDFTITYRERGLVVSDISTGNFEDGWIIGYDGAGALGSEKGPAIEVDGCLAVLFKQVSCIHSHTIATDADGDYVPAVRITASKNVLSDHFGLEDCYNGIHVINSWDVDLRSNAIYYGSRDSVAEDTYAVLIKGNNSQFVRVLGCESSGYDFHIVDRTTHATYGTLYSLAGSAALSFVRSDYCQRELARQIDVVDSLKIGGVQTAALYAQFDQYGTLIFNGTNGTTEIREGGRIDTTRPTFYLNFAAARGFDVNNGQMVLSAAGELTLANGLVSLPNLPTSDPGIAGRLWRNGNVVNISTG